MITAQEDHSIANPPEVRSRRPLRISIPARLGPSFGKPEEGFAN